MIKKFLLAVVLCGIVAYTMAQGSVQYSPDGNAYRFINNTPYDLYCTVQFNNGIVQEFWLAPRYSSPWFPSYGSRGFCQ